MGKYVKSKKNIELLKEFLKKIKPKKTQEDIVHIQSNK